MAHKTIMETSVLILTARFHWHADIRLRRLCTLLGSYVLCKFTEGFLLLQLGVTIHLLVLKMSGHDNSTPNLLRG